MRFSSYTHRHVLALSLLVVLLICGRMAAAEEPTRIFFLHNSVGRLLIEEGQMRDYLEQKNDERGTDLVLWDHNYPYIGLRDPEGDYLGYPYSSVCGHNNNPDGLHMLWLEQSLHPYVEARDSIMTKHDVVAFKSCYRAVDFAGAETLEELAHALEQYKQFYLEMRDFFDQHPDMVFVPLSIPPRHRLHEEASPQRAAHGRMFADWLMSSEFLGSPPRHNIRPFDLFDLLAGPNDGGPHANMLRPEYERSATNPDSHPNALGNAIVGPLLMQWLIDASGESATAVEPLPLAGAPTLLAYPNPFNPSTTLRFDLARSEVVHVQIVDLRGRLVQHLAQGILAAGQHEFRWHGRHQAGHEVPSGVYLGRLRVGARESVRILTLLK